MSRPLSPFVPFPSYHYPDHPDPHQFHTHQRSPFGSPLPSQSPAPMPEPLSPRSFIPPHRPTYNHQPLQRNLGLYIPTRMPAHSNKHRPKPTAHLPVSVAVGQYAWCAVWQRADAEQVEKQVKALKARKERRERKLDKNGKGKGKGKEGLPKKKQSEMIGVGTSAAKAKASIPGSLNADKPISGPSTFNTISTTTKPKPKPKSKPKPKPNPPAPTASSLASHFIAHSNAIATLEDRPPPHIFPIKVLLPAHQPPTYRVSALKIDVEKPDPPPKPIVMPAEKAKATGRKPRDAPKLFDTAPAPPMTRKRKREEDAARPAEEATLPATREPGPSRPARKTRELRARAAAKAAVIFAPRDANIHIDADPDTAPPAVKRRKPRPLPEQSSRVTRSKGDADGEVGNTGAEESVVNGGPEVAIAPAAAAEEVAVVDLPAPKPLATNGRADTIATPQPEQQSVTKKKAPIKRGRAPVVPTPSPAIEAGANEPTTQAPAAPRRGKARAPAVAALPGIEQSAPASLKITVKRPAPSPSPDAIPSSPPPPTDLPVPPTASASASTSKKRPHTDEPDSYTLEAPPAKRKRRSTAEVAVARAEQEAIKAQARAKLVAQQSKSSATRTRSIAPPNRYGQEVRV